MRPSVERAIEVATQGLIWLSEDSDRMGHFLGATGIEPASIRTSATDPVFLASVLDFILMDDASVLDFAQDRGFAADLPMLARSMLPGGDLPNWT